MYELWTCESVRENFLENIIANEQPRPRLRGGSIIEPRVYLDVQGEKISSDPEKR